MNQIPSQKDGKKISVKYHVELSMRAPAYAPVPAPAPVVGGVMVQQVTLTHWGACYRLDKSEPFLVEGVRTYELLQHMSYYATP